MQANPDFDRLKPFIAASNIDSYLNELTDNFKSFSSQLRLDVKPRISDLHNNPQQEIQLKSVIKRLIYVKPKPVVRKSI